MPGVEAKLLAVIALVAYAASAGVLVTVRRAGRPGAARVGVGLLAGAIGLGIALASLRLADGHWPVASGFDTFTLLALLAAGSAAYLRAVGALPRVAIGLLGVATACSGAALALAGPAYREFGHDFWAVAHVAFAASASSCFFAAAAGGLLYLYKHRQLRRKDPALLRSSLPSLERLDRFLRHVLPAAFALVTATILAGLVGALQPQRTGYFRNWVTHPKILAAGITWLVYGLALHVAYARRFRGRTAAGLSVAGFVLLVGVLVASMLLPKT